MELPHNQKIFLNKLQIQPKDFKKVFINKTSLRLSKSGLKLFLKTYESWRFQDHKLVTKDLLSLQRKMIYPYYIDSKSLVLFTEKDAFMAKLAGAQNWIEGK